MANLVITGGCGFLGSNLAAASVQRGFSLTVFDNLARKGASENLQWLRSEGLPFEFVHGDIRNRSDVEALINRAQPDFVFHLAGQVAMTTSIQNPRTDFEVNTLGTLNVLEAVRQAGNQAAVLYSSTNKVYGDLGELVCHEGELRYTLPDCPTGIPESISLCFHSPYGCSKGAADQYLLDYARIYGTKTIVFRHSSMYGGRQFATEDQGWVGWFCDRALSVKKRLIASDGFTVSGNGKQVRDLLHADDMIRLYFSALERVDGASGTAFNIGGGMENSVSILELLDFLSHELKVTLKPRFLPPRVSDQLVFVADCSLAEQKIGWKPQVNWRAGVQGMLTWVSSCLEKANPQAGQEKL